MVKRQFGIIALLLLTFLAPPVVLADDSKTADAASNSSSALQGSVKATDVEAAEKLRQMGECLKKMQRAALELMGEATRQAYISVGDPDVIGTMIIPAIPSPSGMMAVGPYLPIRKKWMDYYLDQIGTLIPIYAEYTDELTMPASTKAQAVGLLDQMRGPFAAGKKNYEELVEMSKKLPDISNKRVAELSVLVHDNFGSIDKTRRDVFQLLKDAEKAEKKN